MKENLKKIGKYLLILLLLVSGVAVLALLFLFFVPSASIFGISYISKDKNTFSKSYATTGISEVRLVNSSYPVRVIDASDNEISVKVHNNTFGYVLTKNKDLTLTSKINELPSGNQLEFTIVEPHGFASKSNSYINLRLPKGFATNLTLVNQSADVNIKLDNSTTINNFVVQSSSGTIDLSSGKIAGNMNLSLSKSNFVVSKDFDLSNSNITVGLTSGTFDSYSNGSVVSNITINKITSGRLNVNNCANIKTENLSDAGGKITIKSLNGSATINSADTNIVIEKAFAVSINIALKKSGSVNIGEIDGSTFSAITNTGNITINKTTAPVYLESKEGNITINSAAITSSITSQAPIKITNHSGKINLTYSTDESYLGTNFWADITNHNGKTTINSVKRLNLTITGSGAANVTYYKVEGESNLTATGTSNIFVKVPTNVGLSEENLNKYTLVTKSEKGSISIVISQTTDLDSPLGDTNADEHPTYVGTKENPPTGQEWTDNVVNIKTYSGSLTVTDR